MPRPSDDFAFVASVGSLDRGAEVWLHTTLRYVPDYLPDDIDPIDAELRGGESLRRSALLSPRWKLLF